MQSPIHVYIAERKKKRTFPRLQIYRKLSPRLWYLQCISNGDTTVLWKAIKNMLIKHLYIPKKSLIIHQTEMFLLQFDTTYHWFQSGWHSCCWGQHRIPAGQISWLQASSRCKSSLEFLRLLHMSHWNILHDNVMTWKYFPHYWPFVRGIHWSPVDSPHKGPVIKSLDMLLAPLSPQVDSLQVIKSWDMWLAWTSCWTNSGVDNLPL